MLSIKCQYFVPDPHDAQPIVPADAVLGTSFLGRRDRSDVGRHCAEAADDVLSAPTLPGGVNACELQCSPFEFGTACFFLSHFRVFVRLISEHLTHSEDDAP